MFALSSIAASGSLAAQATPPVPHSGVPDSTLRPAAVDEEFASWLAAERTAGRAEMPQLVQAGRFEALLLSPLASATLAPDSVFAPMVGLCRAALQLDPADSAEIAGLRPWAAFDAAAARVPLVTIAIVPAHSPMIDCGASQAARHAALARGIRFGRNPNYSASNDAVRAELVVGGERKTPLLAGRAEVTQVAQGRLWENGTGQVRLYVPIDAMRPTAAGRFPRVELHVWNAVNAFPDTLVVPAASLRALWDSELHWRAARLANATVVTATDARPVLPMPRDSVLRRSRERLDAGDHRAAAVLALARLEQGRLEREEQRIGRLQLAFAFDAEGEVAGRDLAVAEVMREEPCLEFDDRAGERYRAMLEPARSSARCTWHSSTRMALLSIVPGLGQAASQGRTGIGVLAAGAVIGAFVMGKAAHADSKALYEQYQQFMGSNAGAASAYDRVESAQARGNTLIMAGTALWLATGIEAVLAERRHRAHIERVSRYGSARAGVGIVPMLGPSTIGVSITF